MSRKRRISIVVPVYNELRNIQKLISSLSDALALVSDSFELIFVDDNSTDGTFEYLYSFRKSSKIRVFRKMGKKGKAYSLIEGFSYAKGAILGMIDADLQYPPSQLPKMINALANSDIVVANRKHYQDSKIRKVLSKTFRHVFGKMLFSLDQDIQSGMKVFTRDVYEAVKFFPHSPWTFDLEFLHRAKEAGFVISNHDITFSPRKEGKSQVKFLKTTVEIGINALAVRAKKIPPLSIPPKEEGTMVGAGVGYKRNKYITHTVLPHTHSAIITFATSQKIFLGLFFSLVLLGLIFKTLLTLQICIAILSVIYFADVVFNLFLILRSLHSAEEVTTTTKELHALSHSKLPVYSILCPLYKEAHVVPQFLEAIGQLDWPKDKLDVILLIEEDDTQTQDVISAMSLPGYVRMLVVPHSIPKTKPKACNYGLSFAKGEYLVIFDAEDKPEKDQLKKAYVAFGKLSRNIICLQAKLNYYNPHQNLLTRLFTAEYSLWFDVTLSGLQALNTALPLGGTSNHFRTQDLRDVLGWDPFNVTEDADLGMRLFKKGYQTAMIDSTTYEEANSNGKNWLRQRSRWIKGYMQTYLVHNRDFFHFIVSNGWHAAIFHLTIGGKIAFILINPLLWITTISYFVLYRYIGSTIESLYPSYVFYMAATSLVFGNFLFLYYYMIGCTKRHQWELMKYVYLVPFYWLMISISGIIALYQLLFKPHYWEKTIHGLHLQKAQQKELAEIVVEVEAIQTGSLPARNIRRKLADIFAKRQSYIGGFLFIAATVAVNVINLVFNVYLGRQVDFEDYAIIGLISGFLSFASILFSGFSTTINFRSGYLIGKYGNGAGYDFWQYIAKRAFYFSLILTGLWLLITPLLMGYFDTDTPLPFVVFSVVIFVGLLNASNRSLLYARFLFGSIAIADLLEAIIKLMIAATLVSVSFHRYTYAAIPFSVALSSVIAWIFTAKQVKKSPHKAPMKDLRIFPKKFFIASVLNSFSGVAFMTLDILLANHYLPPLEAGKYTLLSLVGKMVFFLGGLIGPFIVPIVSRNEGANKSSRNTLHMLVFATAGLSLLGVIAFGVFGSFTVPLLFGQRAAVILPDLIFFSVGMMAYTISKVFVTYYLVKRVYTFTIMTSLLVGLQMLFIGMYHDSFEMIATVMAFIWTTHLLISTCLYMLVSPVKAFENNLADFFGLFAQDKGKKSKKLNILIFNWRDTQHKWAGGAEVYIQELAKRWTVNGNKVTIFCGNSMGRPKYEVIDNVQVIRQGGFYTVYMWAFFYYIFKFKGKYDVIIDCENGIPFFTPLYASEKKFLLIHHVHQAVFRRSLTPPFSWLALFLEAKAMPFVYRNTQVITVSPSSRDEIIRHRLTKTEPMIIYNGVDTKVFFPGKKSEKPMLLYLGRLQRYKSLDILLKATKEIIHKYPDVTLTIAGEGEEKKKLERLAQKLGIGQYVQFVGKVSQKEKVALMQKAWVFVNPSLMEGWGITTIEANACGTPAIAFNVPGLRDSIRDGRTGMLIKKRSVETLVDGITTLLKNRKVRKTMAAESIEWARQFSWTRSATRLYELIFSDTPWKETAIIQKNFVWSKV